mmetsp:Transcript_34541/g.87213  ORF Transcript_34541/g.87213 Transcript_34541/m.87213 type:complete len:245 (-) Transcript_34541:75-809(-)
MPLVIASSTWRTFSLKSRIMLSISDLVRCPPPIIPSSCFSKSPTFSGRHCALLYSSSSSGDSACIFVILSSKDANFADISLSALSSALFCEKEGHCAATSLPNVSIDTMVHRCSGGSSSSFIPPILTSSSSSSSPAAAWAAAAAVSTRGKTWTYLRSVSVLCWYLYMPAHSITAHAPLSSSKPMARRASRQYLGMSSPYFWRTFFPPPTVKEMRSILGETIGSLKAAAMRSEMADAPYPERSWS